MRIHPLVAATCAIGLALCQTEAAGCTTVMAGSAATEDGSVLMSSSCDGDIMGYACIMPGRTYAEDDRITMQRHGDVIEHKLPPVARTHHTILLGAGRDTDGVGGMNEHGVSIGIEFIPMRPELDSTQGLVGPFSDHWTTSLIANGLLRAESAREAVEIIGEMVETYGFYYTWGGSAGVALPIADAEEIWLMEIFGPEAGWSPDSGYAGGVWCAQRVPDDAVSVSANRSRIGEVDLEDTEQFLASSNIYSLAERLQLWEEREPFVWREVYGAPGGRDTALREWRVLSLVAPSKELQHPVDPLAEAYPYAVRPEGPVTVERLIAIMRDGYEGTEFDITQHEAFEVDGQPSPLARPWGPAGLYELLELEPERAIATPTSNHVFVAQLRSWLPDPIGHVLWFAPGPADSSMFVPIYAAVETLPEAWDGPADFDRVNREQIQWNYRLVANLVTNVNYREAIADVLEVIEPAERAFFAQQEAVDARALHHYETTGRDEAKAFLTTHTRQVLDEAAAGYARLLDHLMFEHLYDRPDLARQSPPSITPPRVP